MNYIFSCISLALLMMIPAEPEYPGDWYVKDYYENGTLKVEGWLLKKKRTAYWCRYYENGKVLEEGNYLNGEKTKWWKAYHPNGVLHSEGSFLNGKKTGWWKYYDTDGDIKLIGSYTGGKKDFYWKMFEKGKIISQSKWVDGVVESSITLDYETTESGRYEYVSPEKKLKKGVFELDPNLSRFKFYTQEGEFIYSQIIR